MKKLVFVLLVLFVGITISAQTSIKPIEKTLKFGLSLGFNKSNIMSSSTPLKNGEISNGYGFSIGSLMEIKLSNSFFLKSIVEVALYDSSIEYHKQDTRKSYQINPVSLDLATYLLYKDSKRGFYLLAGPKTKLPPSNSKVSDKYSTAIDFAIDFGIGWDKPFNYFDFAPEIRYSYGLININNNPSIQEKLYIHNLSFIFNFKG